MCGNVGFIGKGGNASIIRSLHKLNISRGTHGTGIFNGIDTSKSALNSVDYHRSKAGKAAMKKLNDNILQFHKEEKNIVILAHTRNAGMNSDKMGFKYAHPHTTKCITGIHNGVIYNARALHKKYASGAAAKDLKKLIDSQIFFNILRYLHGTISDIDKYEETVVDLFKDVEGSATILFYNSETERLYIHKNGRPLHYVEHEGGVYFSSEYAHLESVFKEHNLDVKIQQFPDDTLRVYDVKTLGYSDLVCTIFKQQYTSVGYNSWGNINTYDDYLFGPAAKIRDSFTDSYHTSYANAAATQKAGRVVVGDIVKYRDSYGILMEDNITSYIIYFFCNDNKRGITKTFKYGKTKIRGKHQDLVKFVDSNDGYFIGQKVKYTCDYNDDTSGTYIVDGINDSTINIWRTDGVGSKTHRCVIKCNITKIDTIPEEILKKAIQNLKSSKNQTSNITIHSKITKFDKTRAWYQLKSMGLKSNLIVRHVEDPNSLGLIVPYNFKDIGLQHKIHKTAKDNLQVYVKPLTPDGPFKEGKFIDANLIKYTGTDIATIKPSKNIIIPEELMIHASSEPTPVRKKGHQAVYWYKNRLWLNGHKLGTASNLKYSTDYIGHIEDFTVCLKTNYEYLITWDDKLINGTITPQGLANQAIINQIKCMRAFIQINNLTRLSRIQKGVTYYNPSTHQEAVDYLSDKTTDVAMIEFEVSGYLSDVVFSLDNRKDAPSVYIASECRKIYCVEGIIARSKVDAARIAGYLASGVSSHNIDYRTLSNYSKYPVANTDKWYRKYNKVFVNTSKERVGKDIVKKYYTRSFRKKSATWISVYISEHKYKTLVKKHRLSLEGGGAYLEPVLYQMQHQEHWSRTQKSGIAYHYKFPIDITSQVYYLNGELFTGNYNPQGFSKLVYKIINGHMVKIYNDPNRKSTVSFLNELPSRTRLFAKTKKYIYTDAAGVCHLANSDQAITWYKTLTGQLTGERPLKLSDYDSMILDNISQETLESAISHGIIIKDGETLTIRRGAGTMIWREAMIKDLGLIPADVTPTPEPSIFDKINTQATKIKNAVIVLVNAKAQLKTLGKSEEDKAIIKAFLSTLGNDTDLIKITSNFKKHYTCLVDK